MPCPWPPGWRPSFLQGHPTPIPAGSNFSSPSHLPPPSPASSAYHHKHPPARRLSCQPSLHKSIFSSVECSFPLLQLETPYHVSNPSRCSLPCYLNLRALPQAPSSPVYQVTRWERIKGNVCSSERKGSQKITQLTDNDWDRGPWRAPLVAAGDHFLHLNPRDSPAPTSGAWGALSLCNRGTPTEDHNRRSVNDFRHFRKSRGNHIFARGKYVQASAVGLSGASANCVW